jgi:hypothetical protein
MFWHIPCVIPGCGAQARTGCDCGKPYISKVDQATQAVKANPERSDRAIAKDIGVDHKTVAKARQATGERSPIQRTGLDGKTRKVPEKKALTKPAKAKPLRATLAWRQVGGDAPRDELRSTAQLKDAPRTGRDGKTRKMAEKHAKPNQRSSDSLFQNDPGRDGCQCQPEKKCEQASSLTVAFARDS